MGDEFVRRARDDAGAVRPPLRPVVVQRKLAVGAANDPAELEADRAANAVMRILHQGERAGNVVFARGSTRIRRTQSAAATVGAAGGAVPPEAEAGIRSALAHGQPLEGRVRRAMEHGFDADFSAVRVHDDASAATLNDQVQAHAFTTGRDIFFGAGRYRPASRDGQRLIAHELAHVVQQGHAVTARRRSVVRRAGASTSGDAQPMMDQAPAGAGRTRITMRDGGGEVGSVTVAARGDAAEATGLSVSPERRGNGYGADLLAAAAHRAETAGSSRLTLGSEDQGSGHLDGWYRSLGFQEAGKVDDHTRFEASTSILRSSNRSSRIVRRMEAEILWYEKVPGQQDPVGHTEKKPGGYRLVKGQKIHGISVYERGDVRAASNLEKQKEQEALKAKQREEEAAAKERWARAKAAAITGPVKKTDYKTVFVLDSRQVRFTQDSIGDEFADGGKIEELAEKLRSGKAKFSELPAIRVLQSKGGNFVSLDNRRLWCCRRADVAVRCVWATPTEIARDASKFTSDGGAEGSTHVDVRWKK